VALVTDLVLGLEHDVGIDRRFVAELLASRFHHFLAGDGLVVFLLLECGKGN
jgi:hypothetical protein